jgi:hypothetical protein
LLFFNFPEKTFPEKTFPEKTFPEKTSPEKTFPEKTFPEKTFPCGSFSAPWCLSRPKQKKRKNWDNFLGANLQVCHPKGP